MMNLIILKFLHLIKNGMVINIGWYFLHIQKETMQKKIHILKLVMI